MLLQPSQSTATLEADATSSFTVAALSRYTFSRSLFAIVFRFGTLNDGLSVLKNFNHNLFSTIFKGHPLAYTALASWS